MLNYISSMLGLTAANTSDMPPGLRGVGNGTTYASASCRGWAAPDPAVRLRQTDNGTVRIFGYAVEDLPSGMEVPFAHIGNGGRPLLYLRGDIPAYVSYIMGDDWRSKLRDEKSTNQGHILPSGMIILRPRADESSSSNSQEEREAEERGHCLRMRRCGAVAVRSEPDIVMRETTEQALPTQLFGWPANGGVWILRLRPRSSVESTVLTGSNQVQATELMEIEERFVMAVEQVKKQGSMEEVCRVLEDAGGQFYTAEKECPELAELRLIE